MRPSWFTCGLCLHFGYLPGLGPCPDCHPDEHAEFLAALLEQTGREDAA